MSDQREGLTRPVPAVCGYVIHLSYISDAEGVQADSVVAKPRCYGTRIQVLGTIGLSPISEGGKAVKGPADRMLRDLGHAQSALGVARLYEKLVDVFVLDREDASLREPVEALGMEVAVLDTIMSAPDRARALAQSVIALLPA